ncbi:unnamed protein product [Trichogramma brassicae]|uniref:Uncharacterized protein n=1 Tax=Trichogramma brassicae TaxID=86971 RepID=A0A6H5HWC9_9HYME|nr:unnamed protein product [Trichogramma brassicae]
MILRGHPSTAVARIQLTGRQCDELCFCASRNSAFTSSVACRPRKVLLRRSLLPMSKCACTTDRLVGRKVGVRRRHASECGRVHAGRVRPKLLMGLYAQRSWDFPTNACWTSCLSSGEPTDRRVPRTRWFRRPPEFQGQPESGQQESIKRGRSSLTNHIHYWGYQEQQEEALLQRRGLDTAIWSLHMELCNGDTGLLPSSRFNTLMSMLAVDQCPSTCLLRGNVRFGRYTISGPPRRRALADLSTPPRGRQRRRTPRDIEKMAGAMGPVNQRLLNEPAHSEHPRSRRGGEASPSPSSSTKLTSSFSQRTSQSWLLAILLYCRRGCSSCTGAHVWSTVILSRRVICSPHNWSNIINGSHRVRCEHKQELKMTFLSRHSSVFAVNAYPKSTANTETANMKTRKRVVWKRYKQQNIIPTTIIKITIYMKKLYNKILSDHEGYLVTSSWVEMVTSITTPDGEIFDIPAELQEVSLHTELMKTDIYKEIKITNLKRNQKRNVWILLNAELKTAYVPNIAIKLDPLHDLLRKDREFKWTEECQKSFDEMKKILCSQPSREAELDLAVGSPSELARRPDNQSSTASPTSANQVQGQSSRPRLLRHRELGCLLSNFSQSRLRFLSITLPADARGILGTKFFANNNVVTDYEHKLMILENCMIAFCNEAYEAEKEETHNQPRKMAPMRRIISTEKTDKSGHTQRVAHGSTYDAIESHSALVSAHKMAPLERKIHYWTMKTLSATVKHRHRSLKIPEILKILKNLESLKIPKILEILKIPKILKFLKFLKFLKILKFLKNLKIEKERLLNREPRRSLNPEKITPTLPKSKSGQKKKNAKAMFALSSSIDYSQLDYLVNCASANEMWKKLSNIHEQKSTSNKLALTTKFHEYRKSPNDSIAQHVAKIENIASQLKDIGQTVSDVMIMAKIISTLPSKYNAFISTWDSVPDTDQTMDKLRERLLREETRMSADDDIPRAFAATTIDAKNNGRKQPDKKASSFSLRPPIHPSKTAAQSEKCVRSSNPRVQCSLLRICQLVFGQKPQTRLSPRRGLTRLAIDGAQHSHDEVRSENHTHKRAPDAGAKAQQERMMASEARTTLTR